MNNIRFIPLAAIRDGFGSGKTGWASVVALVFAAILLLSADLYGQSPAHLGLPGLSPHQRAEFALSKKQYDDAIQGFRQILESNEKDGYAIRGLVRSYLGAARLDEGEAYLKERLNQYPNSSIQLYGLGFLYYSRGRSEEAKYLLEQALTNDPQNPLALNNLAAILAEEKSFEKALDYVKKAIEINPGENMFYRSLQFIYGDMGQPDRFQEEYEEYTLKDSPAIAAGYGKTLARTFRQQAFSLYSQGKLDDAITTSLKVVEIYRKIDYKGGLVPGLFALGLLYEEKNNLGIALKYYREALNINPEHIQSREKIDSLTKKN